MKTMTIGLLWLGLSGLVLSQTPDEVQKKAMEKFSWLEGEWDGIAWSQMGPQERDSFWMTEVIAYDLDRTIINIKGIGKDQSGNIAHNARAVISYSAQTQAYQWHAWRIPGGIFNEYEPELSENGFTWAMETPRGNIRYTVTHTEDDGWFEIGEFSADDVNWFKFFEMSLKRSN